MPIFMRLFLFGMCGLEEMFGREGLTAIRVEKSCYLSMAMVDPSCQFSRAKSGQITFVTVVNCQNHQMR